MPLKLKATGLCFLTILAVGALGSANTGATVSGHFTSDAPSGQTTLTGLEEGNHQIDFGSLLFPLCHDSHYHGSLTGSTSQSLEIVPIYSECTNGAVIMPNGCKFVLHPNGSGAGTINLLCPPGKKLEVNAGCKFKLGTQTAPAAVTYTADTHSGKHSLTVHFETAFHYEEHFGICVFGPTTVNNWFMIGSITLRGTDPATGEPVNITAT